MNSKDIGQIRVSQILVHPIKSCRGTSVQRARYTPEGIEHDRRWCIVNADNRKVLTAREVPKMVLITPTIETDTISLHGGKLVVSFPADSGCETFEVPLNPSEDVLHHWEMVNQLLMHQTYSMDGYICQSLCPSSPSPSAVLSKYIQRPVHLMYKGPDPRACVPTHTHPNLEATLKYQDGYPLLVVSEESLEEVRRVVGEYARDDGGVGRKMGVDARWKDGKVEMERFRPNIVFRGAGIPFIEDLAEEIVIAAPSQTDTSSSAVISLVSKCTRCLLPNVDPRMGVRDKAVPFKILMKFRTGVDPVEVTKPCFGCNGVPHGEGVLTVGDAVTIRKWLEG